MVDQKRIFRVLQLIVKMRTTAGFTKKQLAADYDVSIRTIERYFILLENLGFIINKKGEYYKIQAFDKATLQHENLFVFSLEEATEIKNALINQDINGPLKRSLLDKLYAISEIDDVANTLSQLSIPKKISTISEAIKKEHQVVLKNYQSINSKTIKNRLVEPIKFQNYYESLTAFDVGSKQTKQFKINRIAEVENLYKSWEFKAIHKAIKIDLFGISSNKVYPLKLELSTRAMHLLQEEFPDAFPYIIKTKKVNFLQTKIMGLEGVGRFVMGLLTEIKVHQPKELNDYIQAKINDWNKKSET